jgi:hypothetical protein
MRLLCEANADTDKARSDGVTAFKLASRHNHFEVRRLLREAVRRLANRVRRVPHGRVQRLAKRCCNTCSRGKFSGGLGASFMQRVPGEQMLKLTGLTTELICTACAPGTFASVVGADTAAVGSVRTMGKFNGGPGARTCEGGPAGRYSVSAGTAAEPRCTACAPGRLATLGASCTACPLGKFSDRLGASSCESCPAANAQSQQAQPQNSDARPAPREFSTQAGADTAAVCNAYTMGKFSGGLGASSCEDCVPHRRVQRQIGRKFMRSLPSRQRTSFNRHDRRARRHGLRPWMVLHPSGCHTAAVCKRVHHGQGQRPPPFPTRTPWASSATGWARAHAKIACPMGKFCGRLGASSCDHCPADKGPVSTGTTAELGGTACAPGWFSTQAGATPPPFATRAPWASSAAGWARAHAILPGRQRFSFNRPFLTSDARPAPQACSPPKQAPTPPPFATRDRGKEGEYRRAPRAGPVEPLRGPLPFEESLIKDGKRGFGAHFIKPKAGDDYLATAALCAAESSSGG